MRIGALLKLAEFESGRLLMSGPLRQCSRQASPSAIAFQLGASVRKSSSTPTKAANDPVRAFSSAYHESVSCFHEEWSSSPSLATHSLNASGVRAALLRTQLLASRCAQLRASKASVAPSATAKRQFCSSLPIESSHSDTSKPDLGNSTCCVRSSQIALCLAELIQAPLSRHPSSDTASCR